MKVDSIKFGLSGAITCGVFYTLGAIMIRMWPAWSLKMAAPLMYMKSLDMFASSVGICWGGYLMGLVIVLVACFVFFAHMAWLYNVLAKN